MHHANVALHIAAGTIGIVLGLIALVARKGSRVHRAFGRRFTWAAGIVVATAVFGLLVFGTFPALAAVTLTVGYQLTSSLRTLRRHAAGPSRFDAELAAATLAAVVALFVTMGPGDASWTPQIGYPTLGFLAAICIFDLSRGLWLARWRAFWTLDHGIKMSNALFGMMSAGLGNLLPQYQPWTQVGPSFIGTGVGIALVAIYWPRAPAKTAGLSASNE